MFRMFQAELFINTQNENFDRSKQQIGFLRMINSKLEQLENYENWSNT